jgi:hypothetical protein
MRRHFVFLTLLLGSLGVFGTSDALAADNTVPSRAPTVQVGTPFSGAEDNCCPDLWRLGKTVNPGETVQIAVDNTRGTESLDVCVIGPTDDFGYDAEVDAACGDESRGSVESGRSARLYLRYERTAGQPLIRFSSFFDRVDFYTATVEAVLPVPPPKPPDSDDDGIADDADTCPTISGSAPSGCPDEDGDGVPNDADACEEVAGPAAALGCPDRDGDAVRDSADDCPSLGGPAPSGCPRVATKVTLRRRGKRYVGRVTSLNPSCSASRTVVLKAVGRAKRLSSTASRKNGRFSIRLKRRSRARVYVVLAAQTTSTARCGATRSRRIRG